MQEIGNIKIKIFIYKILLWFVKREKKGVSVIFLVIYFQFKEVCVILIKFRYVMCVFVYFYFYC